MQTVTDEEQGKCKTSVKLFKVLVNILSDSIILSLQYCKLI